MVDWHGLFTAYCAMTDPTLSIHRVMDALDQLNHQDAHAPVPRTADQVADQVRTLYAQEGIPLAEDRLNQAIQLCQPSSPEAVPAAEPPKDSAPRQRQPLPLLELIALLGLVTMLISGIFFLFVQIQRNEAAQALAAWVEQPSVTSLRERVQNKPAAQDWKVRMTTTSSTTTFTLDHLTDSTVLRLWASVHELPGFRWELNGRPVHSAADVQTQLDDDNRLTIVEPAGR